VKVVVDATMLDGGPSGAATRLAALGAEHARAGRVEVLHLVRPGATPLPGLACRAFAGLDTPFRRLTAGRRLSALLHEVGADLYLHGTLPLPAVRGVPLLLTLHDLRFLEADGGQGSLRRIWARHRLRPQLRRLAQLVAVSRSTADVLLARHLLAPEQVAVVPNAGTPGLERERDVQRLAAFRRQAGVSGRYLLALGPLAPHKRPEDLLAVLAAVRRDADGSDLSLVFAGRADVRTALALARRAAQLGLTQAVSFVGPLSADALAAALSGAEALLCAGRHEGFAIPAVDAQRLAVPVVAVAAGALPEVLGDGAWLVHPDDLAGFASAVLHAATPGDLREARLQRGRQLAGRWSWERSARALEAVWQQVVEAPAGAGSRRRDG